MLKRACTPAALRWALYDFGNTAFSLVVLALVFPRLYKSLWGAGLSPDAESMAYNFTLSLSSLLVALIAPILAGAAEAGGLRLRLLRRFAVGGALLTAAVGFVPAGCWWGASAVYVAAAAFFFCGNIFYDAMLTDVAAPADRHTVSGLSFSFGYAAGFILLGLIVASKEVATPPMIFAFAGAWWLIFAIPLLTRHADKKTAHAPGGAFALAKLGVAEAWRTLREIWAIKPLRRFLLAYIFFIDGVGTVIGTAAHFAEAVGFEFADVIKAFFVVQIFGVPCALLFGWFGAKYGARRLIGLALVFYICVTAYGAQIKPGPLVFLGLSVSPIMVLAAMVGMVQGGVQALSRSHYASLVPPGRETAFFGFYSMLGKCSTALGPLIGWCAAKLLASKDAGAAEIARINFASIALLFIGGLVFLALAKKSDGGVEKEI